MITLSNNKRQRINAVRTDEVQARRNPRDIVSDFICGPHRSKLRGVFGLHLEEAFFTM